LQDKNIHFLDMPFTGQIKKKPISDEDIAIVTAIIAKNKTTSGFAAGDLEIPMVHTKFA
jgi:glucosamine-6-phosphate deaminase